MLSTIDPVTGIANRRRFDEELARLAAEFDRLQRGFCLVVVDLDEFKEINDQLGHPAGDRVLATFAQSLRQQLRTTDILARVGGDEFAMIFPATDAGSARLIVQRAREQMASELAEAAGDASVGWSAGFAEMKTGWTIAQLLVAADQSMYSAKRERSSRVASAKEKPDIRPGLSK